MYLTPKTTFRGLILAIFSFSLVLRFWRLGQFNELVFDEVYYARFASQYWLGEPFFPSHPPLSHYLIALAMGLGSLFPVNPDHVNELTGVLRSTWSYRWLNALVGSTIPLLLGAIAYQLTQRRRLTILVMGLAALDGLLLVESRYALNNIYLIFFGLAGQALILTYLRQQKWYWLIGGGICLAAAGSVKWNGFAFLLGVYLLWAIAWGQWWYKSCFNKPHDDNESTQFLSTPFWQAWLTISPGPLILWLGVLPLVTYSVIWIPHLWLNPDYASWQGFLRIQWETWQYHRRIGNSPDIHPYCSAWYTWPLMLRPIAYYYKQIGEFKLVTDVHCLANPILLWFTSGAIVGVGIHSRLPRRLQVTLPQDEGLGWYIGINYATNLLPWVGISRCTFFYHYLPSYLFTILALAWILDCLLNHLYRWSKVIAWGMIGAIVVGFWFWSPIFLGLPLTPQGFSLRMWFRSWI